MNDNRKCAELQERARVRIPGMTQLLSKRPDMFSLGVWPGYYSKAKGARVWDLDGNEYLDMSLAGIGANVLGYADPEVDSAVIGAIENGTSCSLNCAEEVELAELLCDIHPWAQMVRFARTGGEAMAVAVRICRAATGKEKVAVCGYHGWHDWYLAANLGTDNALGEHLLSGLEPAGVPRGLAGTVHTFRYNHPEELRAIIAAHGTELAAVVMEPLRNEEPIPNFLEEIRERIHRAGGYLVFDEISAGLRLTSGGAHLKFGVAPDVAVFSKALGNGYAIAAIIGREEPMQAAQRTFISSTNWTERVGFAAGLATLRKHRAVNASSHLCDLGRRVQEGWSEAAARNGLDIHVGGMLPMSHFTFTLKPQESKAYFVQLMLDRGFLASNLYYAMYAQTVSDVESYLGAVEECFGRLLAPWPPAIWKNASGENRLPWDSSDSTKMGT